MLEFRLQAVPTRLPGGDRVNAELQRAPAVSETQQVGVPASAGPYSIDAGDRVNAELQRAPAVSEMQQVALEL